jgi:hypothetical protein
MSLEFEYAFELNETKQDFIAKIESLGYKLVIDSFIMKAVIFGSKAYVRLRSEKDYNGLWNIIFTHKVYENKFPTETEEILFSEELLLNGNFIGKQYEYIYKSILDNVFDINDIFDRILTTIDLVPRLVYEKIRTVYYNRIYGVEIVFDHLPGLLEYIEIEARNKKSLVIVSRLLGFGYSTDKNFGKVDTTKMKIKKLYDIWLGNYTLTFDNVRSAIVPVTNLDIFNRIVSAQESFVELIKSRDKHYIMSKVAIQTDMSTD